MFFPSFIIFISYLVYIITGGFDYLGSFGSIPMLFFWYLMSFGALPFFAVWNMWHEEKQMGPFKAFFWAHIFAFFYVIWFIAACRAVYRLACGKGSWVKTERMEEAA